MPKPVKARKPVRTVHRAMLPTAPNGQNALRPPAPTVLPSRKAVVAVVVAAGVSVSKDRVSAPRWTARLW